MYDYDVIVIGGGSAGSASAAAATQAGARTAMVNDGELGGLCILRGCMPTKAMLASAHAIHEARHLEPFGVKLEGRVVPDFARIMERRGGMVRRFQRAKIRGIEAQPYEVLPGRACFVPGGAVKIDGRSLSARSYVVATGSEPFILPLPGIERVPVWTSDDVMRLESPPEALLVQGAGPIGLELSQFFARIGTRVLLVNRSPLLSHYDAECGAELTHALLDEPRFELAVPGRIAELTADGSGLRARIVSGDETREFRADALLMAAGRRAAIGDLGLEHAGIDAPWGLIEYDAHMRTSNPRVFVAGDATGRYQILHLANQEGRVAGSNAAGVEPAREMDYRLEMSVIFTEPTFAQIGLTEAGARASGRDPLVGRARFPETGRAITMGVEHGLWKLIADRDDGEILGSTILGPRADDLVHLIATLMKFHGSVDDILELPWYHPTLSEVMLDLARTAKRS